ncbi:hypothetical protein GCM10025867_23270 [Frondihabitans sucicola]|uniref:Uncharacterized protein n=1 Tax=Frondihabitans sucicola TaxID=1268041 RepID=A0ABN6Y2B1_9MICO|nr:hypothetical protein [Frondihabitans sucicola]BDZ50086.1 hypothetical protein GCM10025867_23270 [Frondihabitans sucicola]
MKIFVRPFQRAQQLLLFSALFAQRGVTIADGDDIFPGSLVFFGLVLVVLLPRSFANLPRSFANLPRSFANLARVRRSADAHPVRFAEAVP